MKNEETIEVFNSLITINNDRIEGYETATKETEEFDLKALFSQFISTSQKCNLELIREVDFLGGIPAEGTTISGKFFRIWMDVKAALSGKDRTTILDSCEYGEKNAINTYEKALENESEHLSPEQYYMISTQKALLKTDYDHVKTLRDSLGNA